MSFFSANNISAGYAGKHMVRNVTFSVENGHLAGILGANGSGKTTLLKAICGILPHSGTCTLDGRELESLSVRKLARRCGYIPQRSGISIDISALDVVLMGFNPRLRLLDSPGETHKKAALENLDRLGLLALAGRDYAQLSEGQKQLVILARALSQDTPVMLMDEPDSALDFVNRHMVLEKIREVLHDRQRAGLITLHDPNFALTYCDRLLLMKDGRITAEIDMKKATREEVQAALGLIYGEIAVLEYAGRYIMTKRAQEG